MAIQEGMSLDVLSDTYVGLDVIESMFSGMKLRKGDQLRLLASLARAREADSVCVYVCVCVCRVHVHRTYMCKMHARVLCVCVFSAASDAVALVADAGGNGGADDDIRSVSSATTSGDGGPRPSCFISYSWVQKRQAKRLRKFLERNGVSCWMDDNQMQGGAQLFQSIDKGITEAAVVIACISNQYASSVNCKVRLNAHAAASLPLTT